MPWIARRLLRALITLFLLVTFTFFALAARTDPAVLFLGPDTDPEALEAFRLRFGLDVSLAEQFWIYLTGLARLDFGISFRTGDPALALVLSRLPETLALMIPTAILSIGIGIPFGLYAAARQGRPGDQIAMGLAVVGLAVPNFLVGTFLIYQFAVRLAWVDPAGITGWSSYILPVVTMATAEAAAFARFTRGAMVEVMAQPMIETARASGLGAGMIRRVHALPNAALPLITVTGLFVGGLIGGAVITENVFAWPGIGRLLVESVGNRDYAVVQCIVLLIGVTMIVSNFLVDVAYGVADPRIRDLRRASGPADRAHPEAQP